MFLDFIVEAMPRDKKIKDPEINLVKLTRPVVEGVYPRRRLFSLFDRARRSQIVWLTAPAGSGKTTCVASYLQTKKLPVLWYQMDAGDNDVASFFYYLGLAAKKAAPRHRRPLPLLNAAYMAGLPAFSTNYFREFFGRLKRPVVVVFDNYQEVARDGEIQLIVQRGLEQIPEGINVFIVSREDPPELFARERAQGRLAVLGWDECRLTPEETNGIVKLRHRGKPLSAEALHQLHAETQGWVAGLVLLTEQGSKDSAGPVNKAGPVSQAVFDYFANEIFRSSSSAVRTFLLNTVFLPKISVVVAEGVTGDASSKGILEQLTRRNLFTVRHAEGSYEYHPLFRAFLLNRTVSTYTAEYIKDLKQRSADYLAQNGDIETAVGLLLGAQEWGSAMSLVLRHAQALRMQGRAQTLETWLRAFPESLLVENPWALYTLGMCRLPFNPAEARRYFEQAFVLFEKQEDASPLYLIWMSVVESFLIEVDDFGPMLSWIDRYPSLKANRKPPKEKIELASIFTYLAGLFTARFDDPKLPMVAERAKAVFFAESNDRNRLMQSIALFPYHVWRGDTSEFRRLIASFGSVTHPPESAGALAQIHWYMWMTLHKGLEADADGALQMATKGLALADASGIHNSDVHLLGFAIWGQLCVGNIAQARALQHRMALLPHTERMADAFYAHYAFLVLLNDGDLRGAVEEGRRSAELAKRSSSYIGTLSFSLGLAFAYCREGNIDSAVQALAEAQSRAQIIKSTVFLWYCALCEANIHYLRNDLDLTRKALAKGLSLCRECQYVTPAYCPRDTAAELYAVALDAGIEVEFVRKMIAKTHLPPPPNKAPEQWPWPVRIYSFGRFVVVKNDKPITFRGKAQKKPMELLRALVAFGGRDVAVPKLVQALWPHTDGDVGRVTFRANLRRLRELVGEDTIVLSDSHLSINCERCWLDVWAFEQMTESSGDNMPRPDRIRRILEIYRGDFLDEDESVWAITKREMLSATLVRALTKYGADIERKEDWEEASFVYEKAVALTPLSEELYRLLMRCYERLGRAPDALAVYQRCRRIFQNMLRIEPSAQTKALHHEIEQSARSTPITQKAS